MSGKYTMASWSDLALKRQDNRPRVAWVLGGNEWVGSSRLKGILIDKHARDNACGFDSVVAYMPDSSDMCLRWRRVHWTPFLHRIDVMVVQTWTGSTVELLEDCSRAAIPAVFTLSDFEFKRVPPEVFKLSKTVVVSSELLREEASRFHGNVLLIDDPIEVPDVYMRKPTENGHNPELVWMGHHDNWPSVLFLKRLLDCPEFSSIKLRTVSRHADATHQWSPNTCWLDVSQSDIAVIPCKLDEWGKSKSSNRLVSFLAMAYPVVASPIPSYAKLIVHGSNGFLATTKEEWRECIRALRHPDLRDRIGTAARMTQALNDLRIDRVAERWRILFESLVTRPRDNSNNSQP